DAQYFGVPQIRPRAFVVGLNRKLGWEASFPFPEPTTPRPLTVRTVLDQIEKEPLMFEKGLTPQQVAMHYHENHWTMKPRSSKFGETGLRTWGTKTRSFRVLDPERPSWTVAYGHREIHVHPGGHRRVSVLEAMLFQGFDRTYILKGTLSEQVR